MKVKWHNSNNNETNLWRRISKELISLRFAGCSPAIWGVHYRHFEREISLFITFTFLLLSEIFPIALTGDRLVFIAFFSHSAPSRFIIKHKVKLIRIYGTVTFLFRPRKCVLKENAAITKEGTQISNKFC